MTLVPVRSKAKDPGHSPKSRGLCVGKPRLGGPEPRPSPVTPRNALGEGAAREGTVELNPRRFGNAKAQLVDTGDASCPVLPPATLDVSVAARNQSSAMKLALEITPIIPIHRDEIPTDPAWAAELKLDGFRGIADTIRGKLLSKNLNPLKRLRHILDSLPLDCVFDGEICVLDRDGSPSSMTCYSGGLIRSMFSTCYSMGGRYSVHATERASGDYWIKLSSVTDRSSRNCSLVTASHYSRRCARWIWRASSASGRPIFAADAMVQGAQQGIHQYFPAEGNVNG